MKIVAARAKVERRTTFSTLNFRWAKQQMEKLSESSSERSEEKKISHGNDEC